MLKAFFAVVVWGASFVATKVAIREIQPVVLVWVRFGIGVVILGAFVWSRKQLTLPKARDWGFFALLGFLGITFHQWLQSTGLITAQAMTTGWIVASIPIFMVILGWLFLKERLSWLQSSGIVLAALGVLLVITRGNLASLSPGRFSATGDILILISAPNWAVFSILSRSRLKIYPAALMMFYVMLFGWLFSSVLLPGSNGLRTIFSLSLDGWTAVAFLGIFCSGIAYVFWYDALVALPVAQTGAFLYIEPLITLIVAAIVLHEPIHLASLGGGGIILLGVWLVNRNTPNLR